MIYVTNKGDSEFVAEYAYNKYVFPAGETIAIPLPVAEFVFGYGVDDKYAMLVRNGWLRVSNEFDAAMQKLSCFSFSLTEPEKNHNSPVIERVVPMPSHRGGKGAKAKRAA